MKLNKKVLMASLVLASGVAGAEGLGFYGGAKLNFGTLNFKDDDLAGQIQQFTPIVGLGLGGGVKYNFDKVFIGGEVYVNYAFNKTKVEVNDEEIISEMKLTYGLSEEVNFVFGYDLTKEFGVYGLLGINNSKIKVEDVKFKNNIAFQYGVGFHYNIDDNLTFKYQHTVSNPKYKAEEGEGDGIKTLSQNASLGLTYRF